MLTQAGLEAILPKLNKLQKQPNTQVLITEEDGRHQLDAKYTVEIVCDNEMRIKQGLDKGGDKALYTVRYMLDGFPEYGDLQVYRRGELVPGAQSIPHMASNTARRCQRHDAHRTPWERQADELIF